MICAVPYRVKQPKARCHFSTGRAAQIDARPRRDLFQATRSAMKSPHFANAAFFGLP